MRIETVAETIGSNSFGYMDLFHRHGVFGTTEFVQKIETF